MGFSFLSLVQLILSLIESSALMVALLLGLMFGMYRLYQDKLPGTTYGTFDFANYEKPAFHGLVARLAVACFVPTLVIHLLYFLFITRTRHPYIFGMIEFVLEIGAVALFFHFFFKLDRLRMIVLTTATAIFYLLLRAVLFGSYLWG